MGGDPSGIRTRVAALKEPLPLETLGKREMHGEMPNPCLAEVTAFACGAERQEEAPGIVTFWTPGSHYLDTSSESAFGASRTLTASWRASVERCW